MKKFTCDCIDQQFKNSDKVYVGLGELTRTEITCIYRPKGKSTLRKIKLDTNYCPMCGAKLEEVNTVDDDTENQKNI